LKLGETIFFKNFIYALTRKHGNGLILIILLL